MEGKKKSASNSTGTGTNKSSSSIVDELFGRKEAKSSSSPPAGYFATVFPHPNNAAGNDASHSDLYRTLDNHRDGKTKNQATYTKDGKTAYYSTESNESSYFGSSVHYGARDFYGTSPSKSVSEPPKTQKNDENDDSVATRGDWWQGSLYY